MLPQTQTVNERSHLMDKRFGTLAPWQIALLVVLGIAFWFAAVLAVRFGSTAGIFGPTASVITFVLAIPICWVSVLFIKKIAKLEAGQTVSGVGIGIVAATFCDGIALTWGRDLYGSDPNMITFGAAWILWGVGLFLLVAYLLDLRPATEMP
jgi:hypothetical protein